MRVLLLSIFIFIYSGIHATTQADSVDVDSMDVPFLEDLVKAKVDSIRQSYGLSILRKDSILYQAAIDHALYLQNRKKMTHYQSSSLKRSAWERAEYYGAKNFRLIGENIVYNYLNRWKIYNPRTRKERFVFEYTYGDLADELIETWLTSKTHNETLKTPEFNATGVAVSFDEETKEIICVQVFADYK